MAANIPQRITDVADLYDPSIQKMFLKMAETQESQFDKFVNVETGVTDLILKDSSMSGLSEADFVGAENAIIKGEVPVQGFDVSYTQEMLATMTAFTWKDWQYGIKKRKMESVVRELLNALLRKRERLAAEMVNNAHLTSYSASGLNGTTTITLTGGDGLAAASASHTREDGGANWSNIVTTESGTLNPAFDYDAIKAAHRTAANIPDPKGNPMMLNLDTLVCTKGSAVHFRALEIKKAIATGKIPGSADNDGSGVADFAIIALPPQYLTNVAYWAMFDSSKKGDEFGYQYKESVGPTLDPVNVVYLTKELQYTAYMAYDMGFNDMRIFVFSKGTNAA